MTALRRGRRGWLIAALSLFVLIGAVPGPAAAGGTQPRLGTCMNEAGTMAATPGAWTHGTPGRDVIIGSAGNDLIDGRGGDDLICGNGGDDVVKGGGGNDTIWGKRGDDRLFGNDGVDLLFGGPGADELEGGGQFDILYGEEGRDLLRGGPGDNILNGGWHTDRCFSGEAYVSCELPSVDTLLAACPTAVEIARIDAEFDLTFESDPTAGVWACTTGQGSAYLTPLQKRAYNAVRIMERIPFDAALPWTPYDLGDWFARAITGIRFRSDITFSFCCSPAGVINLKTGIASEETDLWMRYPYDLGIAHLVLLMAHEARHAEGPLHTCTWSDDAGGFIDDQTIEENGAWAVQYYLERWFAEHTSPAFLAGPPGYRSFYREQAAVEANFLLPRFCDH